MFHRGTAKKMLAAVVAAGALVTVWASSTDAQGSPGQLYVVQAVPGASYTIEIDGREAKTGVEVGTVLGPFDLAAGNHEVAFTSKGGGQPMTATVKVKAGSGSDLVLHLPAQRGGDPVADVYRAPTGPIAAGKARVLVAHTATVPPADIQVDGTTVFQNIANGEFAQADVPAGHHTAAIVPTGTTGDPLLGPIDVDLPARTLTMVYAVGSPQNGSMNVIAHQEKLASDGSVAPSRVGTGSAGLVGGLRVQPFGPS